MAPFGVCSSAYPDAFLLPHISASRTLISTRVTHLQFAGE